MCFWVHLLGTQPDRSGNVTLLRQQWPAKGWQLPVTQTVV